MEKNPEIESGNYDFGARMYDSRIGRWWSVDPFERTFASESPYIFGGNSPVVMVDIGGNFKWPKGQEAKYEKKYPVLTAYLKSGDLTRLANHKVVQAALLKHTNNELTVAKILEDFEYGKGPTIKIEQLNDYCGSGCVGAYKGLSIVSEIDALYLDTDIINNLENSLSSKREANAEILHTASTIIHEYTHYGDRNNDWADYDSEGRWMDEEGIAVEIAIWGISIDPEFLTWDYSTLLGEREGVPAIDPTLFPIHPLVAPEIKYNEVAPMKVNKINSQGTADVQK